MYVFCVQGSMGEAMSRRIRGVFNAANFWAIVLYNVLSLNSLEFAKTVGRRLIFKGTKQSQHCFILSTLQRSHTVPFCLSLSWPSTNIWSHACFADKSFSLFFCLLSLSGFPLSTLSVLFVTYCGVQLVKERERQQALQEEPEPATPVDGAKEKAE